MREEGIVGETKDNMVCVRFERKPACKGCPVPCEKLNGDTLCLWMENAIGAHKGERVSVFISDTTILASAFLAYGVPTLFFVGGFLIARFVFLFSDIMSVLMALVLLGLSFGFIRSISRSINCRLVPRMERVHRHIG